MGSGEITGEWVHSMGSSGPAFEGIVKGALHRGLPPTLPMRQISPSRYCSSQNLSFPSSSRWSVVPCSRNSHTRIDSTCSVSAETKASEWVVLGQLRLAGGLHEQVGQKRHGIGVQSKFGLLDADERGGLGIQEDG